MFKQVTTKKEYCSIQKSVPFTRKNEILDDNLATCEATAVMMVPEMIPSHHLRDRPATSRGEIHLFGEHGHDARDLFLCVEAGRV